MALITPKGHGLGYVAKQKFQGFPLDTFGLLNAAPPITVDHRALFLPPRDQKQFGACTGFGFAAAMEYELVRQHIPVPSYKSPLYIYNHARSAEGTLDQDAGADPNDVLKILQQWGIPNESYWPYTPETTLTLLPDHAADVAASHRKVINAYTIANGLTGYKKALAAGYCVALAINVYDGLEDDVTATTGVCPMPAGGQTTLGGHLTLGVGYSDIQVANCPPNHVMVRNSWSPDWGDKGYFYLPYEYFSGNGPDGNELVVDMIAIEMVA